MGVSVFKGTLLEFLPNKKWGREKPQTGSLILRLVATSGLTDQKTLPSRA